MTRKIAGHKDFNWKESHGNVFEKQREKKKKKKKRERERRIIRVAIQFAGSSVLESTSIKRA